MDTRITDSTLLTQPAVSQPRSYRVIIIGSGPGGLSAAIHAKSLGLSYILLEGAADFSDTIRKFQVGKLVMAEPRNFPIRGDLPFAEGSRENILASWHSEVARHELNILYNAHVQEVVKENNRFRVTTAKGDVFESYYVVMAIGVQGNIRTLDVPGADHPNIQYQLDDPQAISHEKIVVMGAGDTGVENALALCAHNDVILVNRQLEFVSCNEQNANLLNAAINANALRPLTGATIKRIEHLDDMTPLEVTFKTPKGEERVRCNRIIARLGATTPRSFLEKIGIQFLSDDANALPELNEYHESTVKGLYIVGALAGTPLIKHAINQGYEVVECIRGNPIESVTTMLLRERLSHYLENKHVAEVIAKLRVDVPILATLNQHQLNDFLLESEIRTYQKDEIVFNRNDYSTSFFCIASGGIDLFVEENETASASLETGLFFGEMSLFSGRRRTASVRANQPSVLIETPRRTMLRLINANAALKRQLDEAALKRTIHSHIGLYLSEDEVDTLVQSAKLRVYEASERIFHEGDAPDGLHLIRSGSVTISKKVHGREQILSYVAAGNYVGEMSMVSGKPRSGTATSIVKTETIFLPKTAMEALIESNQQLRNQFDREYLKNIQVQEAQVAGTDAYVERSMAQSVAFLSKQGIGEATDVLLIDYDLCIRCDKCEVACAETHGGASRLNREAGPTFANIHVPTSCRHCEHPHCMKDCPPDAIKRLVTGEVFINDQCIGCGNCVKNCPYDVIQLAKPKSTQLEKPLASFIFSLFTGMNLKNETVAESKEVAVKCDMCINYREGPACVRACPTGAAIRGTPQDFLNLSQYARSSNSAKCDTSGSRS